MKGIIRKVFGNKKRELAEYSTATPNKKDKEADKAFQKPTIYKLTKRG